MTIRNDIKAILAKEGYTIKEMADLMTEKSGKKYSPQGISHKLRRETLLLKEAYLMAEILGCKIKFEKE